MHRKSVFNHTDLDQNIMAVSIVVLKRNVSHDYIEWLYWSWGDDSWFTMAIASTGTAGVFMHYLELNDLVQWHV